MFAAVDGAPVRHDHLSRRACNAQGTGVAMVFKAILWAVGLWLLGLVVALPLVDLF